MKTIDHNTLSEITIHYINLYMDDPDGITGDCIHEWWSQTIWLYIHQLESDGFDLDNYEDLHDLYIQIENAIFNYINILQ